MRSEVKITREAAEASLRIEVPPVELKKYLDEAARLLSTENKIPGFRPGKAPLEVVEKILGKDKVAEVALRKAIPRFFVETVLEHEIEALARPTVEIELWEQEKGLVFTAKTQILPEVRLGDLKKIESQRGAVEVKEEEVEKELIALAKNRGSYIEAGRPAKEGDRAVIDFTVKINGNVIEGGEGKDHPVKLGEGRFVPGFEKGLEALRAGEEKEFTIRFPDNFAKKELKGQEAQVRVIAHKIEKQIVPEINDDFAKSLGKFTSIGELRKQLKENLLAEKERKEEERWRGELAEKLAETAEFSMIPPVLIDKEIDRQIGEIEQMLAWQHKTMAEYVAGTGKSEEQIREGMRAGATRAVKVSLAIRKLAEQEKITVDDQEIENEVNEYVKHYGSAARANKEVDTEELKEQLRYTRRNQKTLDFLTKLVKTNDN
jgi:trigger factor